MSALRLKYVMPLILLGTLGFQSPLFASDQKNYLPPAVSTQGKMERYIRPILWTPKRSKPDFFYKGDSPESVVISFYTHLMRSTQAEERFLLPSEKRSKKLNSALKEYQQWEFLAIKLKSRQKIAPEECWITIDMVLAFKNRIDQGADQVHVKKVNGHWVILGLPT